MKMHIFDSEDRLNSFLNKHRNTEFDIQVVYNHKTGIVMFYAIEQNPKKVDRFKKGLEVSLAGPNSCRDKIVVDQELCSVKDKPYVPVSGCKHEQIYGAK